MGPCGSSLRACSPWTTDPNLEPTTREAWQGARGDGRGKKQSNGEQEEHSVGRNKEEEKKAPETEKTQTPVTKQLSSDCFMLPTSLALLLL